MRLEVINSNSAGNCLFLHNGDKTVVLDCGLPFADIRKALDFDLKRVSCVTCSHVHADHSYSYKDWEKSGIFVHAPWKYGNNIVAFQNDGFTVRAFPVKHDVPCYGFLINNKILYATDCEYIKYTFKHLHLETIIIECNYQEEYVTENNAKTEHVFRGHMSLQTCIDFLRANQTDALKNVILCHMSRNNADPEECKQKVMETVGDSVNVYIAEKGLRIEL